MVLTKCTVECLIRRLLDDNCFYHHAVKIDGYAVYDSLEVVKFSISISMLCVNMFLSL